MHRIYSYAILLPLLPGIFSCTGKNAGREQVPVTIQAVADRTRSVVSGHTLPESYTVYVSAFYTNPFVSGEAGNYFVAAPFRNNGLQWVAVPTHYWPIGGKLDFLSIACESDSLDVTSDASWNEGNCTEGVEIALEDGKCLCSEILFASTRGRTSREGSIQMQFTHSQSWLHFCVSSSVGTIRIDSIKVKNVYTGGTLRIDNRVYMDAGWSFRGHRKEDRTVPGSRGLIPLDGTPAVCDMLVPEQDACDLDIHYSMRSSPSDDWSGAVNCVYRYEAGATPWHCGQKNVFRIVFTPQQISLTSSVSRWDDVTEDIDINDD